MKTHTFPVYNTHFLQAEKNVNFYANTFPEYLKQYAGKIRTPQKQNFYLSVLFTKGSGGYEIDFIKYRIKPGHVFMILPGQVQTWQFSKDIDGYVFFHSKEFYNLYFLSPRIEDYPFYVSIYNERFIVLNNKNCEKIKAIFSDIVAEYMHNKMMKYHKLCSLLTLVYIELLRFYVSEDNRVRQNNTALNVVKNLEELIELHYKTIKYPRDFAKLMNMSESNLYRIGKKTSGKTTSELISDRIVLEAKRMIAHSDYSVSQIADELGFQDSAYFFRLFKKKTGETPSEFLARFRKGI